MSDAVIVNGVLTAACIASAVICWWALRGLRAECHALRRLIERNYDR